MKKRTIHNGFWYLLNSVGLMLLGSCQSTPPVDFSTQIKPILNNKCITCHGGVKKSGGFSLLFEDEAFAKTESGVAAIIPGNAAGSEMIKRLHEEDPELRMPYEKPKLTDEEIDLLTRWIDEGAKWGQHWAYSLPEKVEVPQINIEASLAPTSASDFVQNDIDHFILARLNEKNLQPNPSAKKNIIARRLSLDIIGLPPSQELLDRFESEELSYEDLVDTLLNQKTYGEKWATWWLDLARYADSKGYEKDMARSIWRYRDWVIDAFNRDLPYDQFTIEQLAGDLLPEPSPDQLIATAFHRNTMNNDEGGTDDEEYRVATVIDRVNTTFEVWQSTTIGCVQCHSHPYDPFKYEEFYKLMAFFNNSRDEDTPGESPVLKFYTPDQQEKVDKVIEWATKYGNEASAKTYKDFLQFTEPVYKSHFFKEINNGSYDDHASVVLWDKGNCIIENGYTNNASYVYLNYRSHYDGTKFIIRERDAEGPIIGEFTINKQKQNITARFPIKKLDRQGDIYIETHNANAKKEANLMNLYWVTFIPDLPGEGQAGYKEMGVNLMEALNTKTPTVPIMVENPDYMKRTSQLFDRGSWMSKTDTVEPGTPESLNAWNPDWPANRLGLAQWIVDKKNPLTARTLVNRVWHQIYGRGLVSTVEDIGSQSDAPSHPAMLDWLSLRFMNEHNWSIKKLVREIVMSGTYRQSSESTPEMYEIDPENELYARGPRMRLGAEQIRDQALAVSGLLSPKMYGPGVMPPQPDGVWQTVYSDAQWVESKGEDRYRRGIYTFLKRTSPYPSFLTFDAGSREVATIRRTVTNTPLQALVTLNDPVYLETAYHLAKNNYRPDDIEQSIALSYKKATFKEISPNRLEALKALYQTSLAEFHKNSEASKLLLSFEEKPTAELSALTLVANAIMNLDEFLTKV
ncbi:PSD1 and planctomycete cytochrome C domain-containing protein [Zobellia uliginosa]|uniref:PSD1 and planctomycete cytochrome C domain-containing protein n=1 Tax=Zobellia uliginosa TaxID=143224 RepID=UPI0026E2EE62|nr:PSD1 and planctomycete cytochrome C domain-containing protein [Zobellia uliginosa]MDO6519495.1 PSD1 and planctomycete cytochrome C domain-containing protein [Zobellia uliginosa]